MKESHQGAVALEPSPATSFWLARVRTLVAAGLGAEGGDGQLRSQFLKTGDFIH